MTTWTDGLILGTSNASAGDDELRSFMTQLASGISASFVWPGSGGGSLASAGESVLGNARTARAGNSAVTGGYDNGFLLINTNHVSLHHIGSTWTGMLGHSSMVGHNTNTLLTMPTGKRWVTQRGTVILNPISDVNGTNAVSFASSFDTVPAFLQLSVAQSILTSNGYIVSYMSLTASAFSMPFDVLGILAPSSVGTVYWESNGTMTF